MIINIWRKLCCIYQYLFYKFYSWHVWLNGGDYYSEQTACVTLSFLVGVEIFPLLITMQILTGYGFEQIANSKFHILLVQLPFWVLNH